MKGVGEGVELGAWNKVLGIPLVDLPSRLVLHDTNLGRVDPREVLFTSLPCRMVP